MLLWDREMESALPRIEQMTPDQRYAVAVEAIDRTLASFDPPADRGSAAVQLLERCLDEARSSVGRNYIGRALPEGAAEEMTSIVAEGAEPGIAQLIMAVANCYGIPESGMAPEYLYTVLSDSYAAVVDHEELEDDSIEEELANPRCVATIAWQQELISG